MKKAAPGTTPPTLARPPGTRLALVAATAAALIALAYFVRLGAPSQHTSSRPRSAEPASTGIESAANSPAYLGSAACSGCHEHEFAAWRGSQHAQAMQVADDRTVLGNFADARYVHRGVTSRFFRKDGAFFVRTDGPDGKLADFQVRQTFGVYPLQQYLVELPGGHVQALSIAWDSRPRDRGGQRWFHLYPTETITHDDELHWTRRQQNWNYMCSDCHSTNVHKNYDAASNTYATTWSEISIGCEGCHGPGSNHVQLAKSAGSQGHALPRTGLTTQLDERRGVAWTIDPATGNAARSVPRTTQRELDVCAQCHSRRTQLTDDYRPGEPYLDHYLPALLTTGLYHADGQQRDEVYNWGSFLSSRMNAAGVTCSDCHDPHTQQIRASSNAVCAQCHAAAKYDDPQHHFHKPGTPGAACASCHMKTETYMVVDARHDHSFRVPRPDVSAAVGAPNACNACHTDRTAQWAAAEIAKRYPHPWQAFQDFGAAFAAADRGDPRAAGALTMIARGAAESAIARASALDRLATLPGEAALRVSTVALQDPNALVRYAALQTFASVAPLQRVAVVAPLLSDPARIVRIEAARLLAPLASDAIEPPARAALAAATAEYVATERYNADRPEHRTNLGTFLAEQTNHAAAEAEYRAALALDPRYTPAWVNLADLMRQQGREADAERILREGLAAVPGDAALHHALGLSLVRLRRIADALPELASATKFEPANARYAYVYAVALDSAGRKRESMQTLERALQSNPYDRDILGALVAYARERGDAARAERYEQRLLELQPQDAAAATPSTPPAD